MGRRHSGLAASLMPAHPLPVLEELHQLRQQLEAALHAAHPVLVFAAMVVLPLGPFPASLLFVLAGNRFGAGVGFVVSLAALAANMSAGYWLARRLLRGPLQAWLGRRGYAVPEFAPADELRFLLLFRITPGMPLFIQNYVLGLAGVRFSRYLAVSLAAQAPYVLAFTWLGKTITEGSGWKLATGLAALVAVVLAVNLGRRFLARSRDRAAAKLP